jgi:hypothetical protein
MSTEPTTARSLSLEQALATTEAAADAALRAVGAATKAIKQARSAAHVGNLRELRPALAAAEQAVAVVQTQVSQTLESWEFDEDAYLSDGSFPRELLEAASRANLRMFEQDERLYCYPALIRVLTAERAVLVDRDRERRLRPSVLVAQLQAMQRRPPRFKPEAFLEALLNAYTALVAKRGKDAFGRGVAERLVDIYGLLTLLPGQTREYSRQEFARDVYLLDRSGVTVTRDHQVVSFPASSGTRSGSAIIRLVTESGEEKIYYGIAFTAAQ